MTPTRPLGSARHALESCTLQLHAWNPFHLYSPPPHLDPPYPIPAKKPCRSDRSTAPVAPGDTLDLSRLSLLDDPPPQQHQHQQQQRFREEGLGGWLARKRRRRRGGSRSISGRSSERTGTRRRCCSVGGGASGAYATCSDFPVVAGGTDSSGELFMNGDGNWGSDVSEVRISRRDSRDGGSGGGGLDREAPYAAPYQGGLGILDLQGNESGYASETGYRGDAEFGYGDEFDEEEDDGRVLFWGDQFGGYFFNPRFMYGADAHVDGEMLQGTLKVIGRLSRNLEKRLEAEVEMNHYRMRTETYADSQLQYAVGRVSPDNDHMKEVGENKFSDQKMHHRCRRKKHDCPIIDHLS